MADLSGCAAELGGSSSTLEALVGNRLNVPAALPFPQSLASLQAPQIRGFYTPSARKLMPLALIPSLSFLT
jgi:hypothetical protein